MKMFQFYGHKPNPYRLSIIGQEPVDQKEFDSKALQSFLTVYRNEIRKTISNTHRMFVDGIYAKLEPQYGAFERLLEVVESNPKNKITSIHYASHEKDEFMVCAAISIVNDKKTVTLVEVNLGICKAYNYLQAEPTVFDASTEFVKEKIFDVDLECADLISGLRAERRFGTFNQNSNFFRSAEGFFYDFQVVGKASLN